MPDLLPLTGSAITDYQAHLSRHPSTDPIILAYLARHINGLMCAEIEQVTTRLIRERLEIGCSDTATANFLKSMRRGAIRNAKYSEIRDSLSLFGNEYRDRFSELIQVSIGENGIERLGMAVGKRDQDAHDNPPDITFRELEEAYTIAVTVMDAVQQTLKS